MKVGPQSSGKPTAKTNSKVLYAIFQAGVPILLLMSAVHCKFADAPNGRYQIASHEVFDTQTGLRWQQVSSPAPISWLEAEAYCKAPWRLPTMKELQTLVDESRIDPAIDALAFPDVYEMTEFGYWSSSPVAGLSGYAWIVRFSAGATDYGDLAYDYRVRCVH